MRNGVCGSEERVGCGGKGWGEWDDGKGQGGDSGEESSTGFLGAKVADAENSAMLRIWAIVVCHGAMASSE